ncbi:hypothetical protein PIROE2DRAFT_17813 [Piromyces sp. E2]|nr:hypothetical protein PIROE2DRAFT_17813 [Piromyces sp. E2]|eukprot:OUM57259.1 hypothetical protein PIROE2DRAFT_17813 [Piromyces sp. E2]
MDKLDPWVYYFVESTKNLIYAISQLCRAIKQYTPSISNSEINELFKKEYGNVSHKVYQIIYSLERFDKGMLEPSLHNRLCSDLKIIVLTTIPDVKKLLMTTQSNLKLLMENTNIRVSRNFLFTCHSVIVEIHAATESVLKAIPAIGCNINSIQPPTLTEPTSSTSTSLLMNHKLNNSKSVDVSPSSTVISTSAPTGINDNASNLLDISGNSLSESLTGFYDSGKSNEDEKLKSMKMNQVITDNNDSNITNQIPYSVPKQQPLSKNVSHYPSQQLKIETHIYPRKESLKSSVSNSASESVVTDVNNDSINAIKNFEMNKNNTNDDENSIPSSSIVSPIQNNTDNETYNRSNEVSVKKDQNGQAHTQKQTPLKLFSPTTTTNRLNNLHNLSLTYELKEFIYPLEDQFFILSFYSLCSSYSCLELLKNTFDFMKKTTLASESPDIYQLINDCAGPHMNKTRNIIDNYYEKFLTCINYTINGNVDPISSESNTTNTSSKNLIPIKNITLNNATIINPNSTLEEHRSLYENSIKYIHSLIQYTIIIKEMTQSISFNRNVNVIVSLQNVTKSAKKLVIFCSKK